MASDRDEAQAGAQDTSQPCPKCGAPMERGRLAGYKWISFNSDSERHKPVGKGERVVAFRCSACAFVEIYAGEPHFWRPR